MTAPVAWLLDTNVVSEMMRPNPEPRVAGFLDTIAEDGIGLAAITVWEILNGIGRLDSGPRLDRSGHADEGEPGAPGAVVWASHGDPRGRAVAR